MSHLQIVLERALMRVDALCGGEVFLMQQGVVLLEPLKSWGGCWSKGVFFSCVAVSVKKMSIWGSNDTEEMSKLKHRLSFLQGCCLQRGRAELCWLMMWFSCGF